jgi:hypothetical protein
MVNLDISHEVTVGLAHHTFLFEILSLEHRLNRICQNGEQLIPVRLWICHDRVQLSRANRQVRLQSAEWIFLHAVEIDVLFVCPFPRSRRKSRRERNSHQAPDFTMASIQTTRGINTINSANRGRTDFISVDTVTQNLIGQVFRKDTIILKSKAIAFEQEYLRNNFKIFSRTTSMQADVGCNQSFENGNLKKFAETFFFEMCLNMGLKFPPDR